MKNKQQYRSSFKAMRQHPSHKTASIVYTAEQVRQICTRVTKETIELVSGAFILGLNGPDFKWSTVRLNRLLEKANLHIQCVQEQEITLDDIKTMVMEIPFDHWQVYKDLKNPNKPTTQDDIYDKLMNLFQRRPQNETAD